MGQITVFPGAERRRRWSDEQRLQILAEAFPPGASPTEVGRRHEASTGQLYTWRSKLAADTATPPPDQEERPDFAEALVIDGGHQALSGSNATQPSSLICRCRRITDLSIGITGADGSGAAGAAVIPPGARVSIARLKREQYGARAERTRRLLDPMELQLEELEADTSDDALVADTVAQKTASVRSFERKPPVRNPFPEHLPRERVVMPSPCSCPACGSAKAWLFRGSDRGGDRAAFLYTLIQTAKLNNVDPQAWLADVLARIAVIQHSASTRCCHGTGRDWSRSRRPPEGSAVQVVQRPLRGKPPQRRGQGHRGAGQTKVPEYGCLEELLEERFSEFIKDS